MPLRPDWEPPRTAVAGLGRMARPWLEWLGSRTEASAAVEALGWRYLLAALCAIGPGELARQERRRDDGGGACGQGADGHLRVDLRPDRVELSLQDRVANAVTRRDTELAAAVSSAVVGLGVAIAPPVSAAYPRPVQMLELAIDALDIPAIRPFWRTVLGYGDEPGYDEPDAAVVDPAGPGPGDLVPADGRAAAAAQPDSLRHHGVR